MKVIHARHVKLMAVPLVALAVALLLVLTWGASGATTTQATEGSKTQMDLVINQASPPVTCNSKTDSTCNIALGGPFTISVIPSVRPVGGYAGWVTLVEYGNLNYLPGPGPVGGGEIKWDQTFFQSRNPDFASGKEGDVQHSDVSSFFPDPGNPVSQQKSSLVNLDFTCSGNNKTPGETFAQKVRLVPRSETPAGSIYINNGIADAPNVSQITITCKVPATDTPTPTATVPPTDTPVPPPPPVGGLAFDPDPNALALPTSESSSNAGLPAVVAAAVAVGGGALGAAWYARRRVGS